MTHIEKHTTKKKKSKKSKKNKRSKKIKIHRGSGPRKISKEKKEKIYDDLKKIHEEDMGNITEIERYLDELTDDDVYEEVVNPIEERKILLDSIMKGNYNFLTESYDSDTYIEPYYDSDMLNVANRLGVKKRRRISVKENNVIDLVSKSPPDKKINSSPNNLQSLSEQNPHYRDTKKKHNFTSVTTLTGYLFSYKNYSNTVTEAMLLGTKLHKDIENYYNTGKSNNNTKEFRYFEKFVKEETNIKPYRTEWAIYDEDIKMSGTVDMVFKNEDDTYSIYDWKRQSYFTNDDKKRYSLQLNLYKKILESKYNLKVNGLFLLCLHPKNNDYQIITIKPEVIYDSYIMGIIDSTEFRIHSKNKLKYFKKNNQINDNDSPNWQIQKKIYENEEKS